MNQIIIFCATYLIYISMLYVGIFVLLKHERKNYIKHIVLIFGTAILAWITAHVLKNIFAVPRPDSLNAIIIPDSLYSFPSGHATFMFALAWSMYGFNKNTGLVLFILATLTGIARVLAGVHFWYDILGGFVVGWIVSYIVFRIVKKLH